MTNALKEARDARNGQLTCEERIEHGIRLIRAGYTAEETARSLDIAIEALNTAWETWKAERRQRTRAYRRSVGRMQ